jgi:hypothetical protein
MVSLKQQVYQSTNLFEIHFILGMFSSDSLILVALLSKLIQKNIIWN